MLDSSGARSESTLTTRVNEADELALISRFGRVSYVVDTNVRAEVGDESAFVDLISVGALTHSAPALDLSLELSAFEAGKR